ETANEAIKMGLFICGKRTPVRKSLKEPLRCLKCQKVGTGHLAATCKDTKDTCPRCGGEHRAVDCTIMADSLKCSNCKESGHGAADRNCPYFRKRITQHLEKDPQNKLRFFPTSSEFTW
ncbi:hypothetical protein BD779DRAFT_1386322, partial [Infundibulicybe gibba]